MIILDTALLKRESEGNPIRVGMTGAGFMGRGIALQITQSTPGMELVAIANRHPENARRAYEEAGIADSQEAKSQTELNELIASGRHAYTGDAMTLCRADGIDAIIEVTGAVEFSAGVALEAIASGKHLVLMNAELDSTVGALLKVRGDEAGVVVTNADGDQPGVIVNLYRFVKGIGMKPVLCGNIKGLQDPYRNPTTQKGFAEKWGQQPTMVTSFADGTKISFEQAIVANATGMTVAKRGMLGPVVDPGTDIRKAPEWYPVEALETEGGIVDYVVGAEPNAGVFVLAKNDNPQQQHYLNLYKLGEGPYYCFFNPYHLCHFEVHNTVARAVLFGDATMAPLGAPYVHVVATAKKDLKEGETIDCIGGYATYGECENADVVLAERLLPMGIGEGCVLKRDISKDQTITFDDVVIPEGRLIDKLWREQEQMFG